MKRIALALAVGVFGVAALAATDAPADDSGYSYYGGSSSSSSSSSSSTYPTLRPRAYAPAQTYESHRPTVYYYTAVVDETAATPPEVRRPTNHVWRKRERPSGWTYGGERPAGESDAWNTVDEIELEEMIREDAVESDAKAEAEMEKAVAKVQAEAAAKAAEVPVTTESSAEKVPELTPEERELEAYVARLRGELDQMSYRIRTLRMQGRVDEADEMLDSYWALAEKLKNPVVPDKSTVEVAVVDEKPQPKPQPKPPVKEQPAKPEPKKPEPPKQQPPQPKPPKQEPVKPEPKPQPQPEKKPELGLGGSSLAGELYRQTERRVTELHKAAGMLEASARHFQSAEFPEEAQRVRQYATNVEEQATQMLQSARSQADSQGVDVSGGASKSADVARINQQVDDVQRAVLAAEQRVRNAASSDVKDVRATVDRLRKQVEDLRAKLDDLASEL